jgi:hypothetical protein
LIIVWIQLMGNVLYARKITGLKMEDVLDLSQIDVIPVLMGILWGKMEDVISFLLGVLVMEVMGSVRDVMILLC